VKIWKVILATLVIFAAGAFAGGWWVKSNIPVAGPAKDSIPPILSQQHFQARLKKELNLTADQTNRIDKIFAESNEQVKAMWGLLRPELQKERQEVAKNIRAILTAEQRETFEKLLKEPPRRQGGPGRPRGTNQTNSAAMPGK
jgi:Spy/CpxP family protein refolding chaperone